MDVRASTTSRRASVMIWLYCSTASSYCASCAARFARRLPASNKRQRERRRQAVLPVGGAEQIGGTQVLQADEGQQIHIRIELRGSLANALRGGFHPPALCHEIRTMPEQFSGHARWAGRAAPQRSARGRGCSRRDPALLRSVPPARDGRGWPHPSSCSICSRAAGRAACAWVSSRRESRPAALRSRVSARTCSRCLSVSRATCSCRLSSCNRAYTCAMFAARVSRAACESTSAARSVPTALSYAARFLPQKSTLPGQGGGQLRQRAPVAGERRRKQTVFGEPAAHGLAAQSRTGVPGAVGCGNLCEGRARAGLGNAQARDCRRAPH